MNIFIESMHVFTGKTNYFDRHCVATGGGGEGDDEDSAEERVKKMWRPLVTTPTLMLRIVIHHEIAYLLGKINHHSLLLLCHFDRFHVGGN